MWGHMDGWGFGGMGYGMLLFWGLVILIIVVLLRNLWGSRDLNLPEKEKSALEILDERYARGEIGKEEYDEKKRDLRG